MYGLRAAAAVKFRREEAMGAMALLPIYDSSLPICDSSASLEASCCCTPSSRACNRSAFCRISCGQDARITQGRNLAEKRRFWRGKSHTVVLGTPTQSHISPILLGYDDKRMGGGELLLHPLQPRLQSLHALPHFLLPRGTHQPLLSEEGST